MRHMKKLSTASRLLAIAVGAIGLATATSASAQTAAPPPAPAAAPAESGTTPPPAAPKETERTANNALYIEGLGPALLYSINYDRAFSEFAVRVGLEYFSIGATNADGSSASAAFLAVPVTVSYLGIGSLKHMFEVGAGGALLYFGGSVNTLGNKTSGSAVAGIGTVILGYRYQPPDGGFFLRAGLSPLLSTAGGVNFLPWPYLGLGATF